MASPLLPWVFRNSTSESEINSTANVGENAKLRRFRLAFFFFFAVEKQKLFHILSVTLAFVSIMQSACTVLYCHLWPAWFYCFPPIFSSAAQFSEKKSY